MVLDHKAPDAQATEYKVQITKVDKQTTTADMIKELSMASDSLKVAVSNKDLEALKNGVSSKLGEVAVNAVLSNIVR